MTSERTHTHIQTNGVKLHVVQAGPQDGPLVILLHGFPEFWYGWRRQIDFLAAAGFRVFAPDQRGYNLSDKPTEVSAYNQDELSADVVGLIDAAGRDKACLVGHDWGGAVAWWTAMKHAERLDRLVILNAPHHRVFGRTLRADPTQRRKSRYMRFFQIRWLPEAVMRTGDWAVLVRRLKQTSRPGAFTEEDLAEYREAWSQPGAMTAMVNWYRAARLARRPDNPQIAAPTLVIWGQRDDFLNWEMAQASAEMCADGRFVLIEDATHWVQHEEAEQVNRLIAEFLGAALRRG